MLQNHVQLIGRPAKVLQAAGSRVQLAITANNADTPPRALCALQEKGVRFHPKGATLAPLR